MAFLSGVQTDETEIELLHTGDVPLQGFQYHVIAGRYVHRAAQALLRAYQDTVDGGVELRHDFLTFPEATSPLTKNTGLCGDFPDQALVGRGESRLVHPSHLARYCPHEPSTMRTIALGYSSP